MLRYYAKKSFNEEPQLVKEPPIERAWIYGNRVTSDELSKVGEHYSLNTGILRDVLDLNELPRLEYTQGVLYVFVRTPHRSQRSNISTAPFLAILKGSLLVTLSTKDYVEPAELFKRSNTGMKSSKHIFLQLLGQVIYQYQTYISASGDNIRGTERRLRTHDVDTRDFINFVTVETELNEFRTNLTAIDVVLRRIGENKHALFNEKELEYIEDIVLQCQQLLVASESHLNLADSIRNAYSAIANNTMNLRMKKLTLLTLLVALPNVFFGMYGMNVMLPIADEPWAYYAVTGISLLIVTVVALFVRKIKY